VTYLTLSVACLALFCLLAYLDRREYVRARARKRTERVEQIAEALRELRFQAINKKT
jgi:hypothetical protein